VQEFVEGEEGYMVPADSNDDDEEETADVAEMPTDEPDTYDPFAR
jgi:hypothetical protein